MLRNRSHVAQEYFNIFAGLLNIVFSIETQCFITLGPVMSSDCFNGFRSFSFAGCSSNLADSSTIAECFDCAFNGFNSSQLAGQIVGVDVSNVSSNSSFAFFLQFRSILFAALQRFFRHVRVHVYADSTVAAHFQSFEAFSQNVSNLCLRIAGFQSFDDAAHFFNLLELSPDFFGDLFGQGFNAPGTAGSIDRAQHTKFFLQHYMQVTSNTTGEYVAFTDQLVKRRIIIGAYAAYNAGEGLGAVTQHINIRVNNGLSEASATAMNLDSAVCFFSTEGFHNSCPDHTQGTQFCDFHEEVCTLVEAEVQGVSNVVQLNATFLHLTYIFNCSSEGISNLLYCFCTAIGVNVTVDENSAQLRSISFSKFNGFSHFIIQSFQRGFSFAGFYHFADRVAADNTTQSFNIMTSALQSSYSQSQQIFSAGAGVHHDRIFIEFQTIKQNAHVFNGSNVHANIAGFFCILNVYAVLSCSIQFDIVNSGAFGNFFLQQFIVISRQGFIAGLRNTPGLVYVTVNGCTTQEIAHTRIIVSRQDCISTFTSINRIKGNPLVVFRVHDFVKRFTLQQCVACFHPFIPGGFSKLIKSNLRELCYFL